MKTTVLTLAYASGSAALANAYAFPLPIAKDETPRIITKTIYDTTVHSVPSASRLLAARKNIHSHPQPEAQSSSINLEDQLTRQNDQVRDTIVTRAGSTSNTPKDRRQVEEAQTLEGTGQHVNDPLNSGVTSALHETEAKLPFTRLIDRLTNRPSFTPYTNATRTLHPRDLHDVFPFATGQGYYEVEIMVNGYDAKLPIFEPNAKAFCEKIKTEKPISVPTDAPLSETKTKTKTNGSDKSYKSTTTATATSKEAGEITTLADIITSTSTEKASHTSEEKTTDQPQSTGAEPTLTTKESKSKKPKVTTSTGTPVSMDAAGSAAGVGAENMKLTHSDTDTLPSFVFLSTTLATPSSGLKKPIQRHTKIATPAESDDIDDSADVTKLKVKREEVRVNREVQDSARPWYRAPFVWFHSDDKAPEIDELQAAAYSAALASKLRENYDSTPTNSFDDDDDDNDAEDEEETASSETTAVASKLRENSAPTTSVDDADIASSEGSNLASRLSHATETSNSNSNSDAVSDPDSTTTTKTSSKHHSISTSSYEKSTSTKQNKLKITKTEAPVKTTFEIGTHPTPHATSAAKATSTSSTDDSDDDVDEDDDSDTDTDPDSPSSSTKKPTPSSTTKPPSVSSSNKSTLTSSPSPTSTSPASTAPPHPSTSSAHFTDHKLQWWVWVGAALGFFWVPGLWEFRSHAWGEINWGIGDEYLRDRGVRRVEGFSGTGGQ
jgi:hypothetical protein